jgi:hypothetical protein
VATTAITIASVVAVVVIIMAAATVRTTAAVIAVTVVGMYCARAQGNTSEYEEGQGPTKKRG